MQRRWVVDVTEEVILVDEAAKDWIIEARAGVVEVGFPIELVSRVREALWVFV